MGEASGAMLPEDRVARTMDLQEDIAAKLEILKGCAATEAALLPQGDKVDKDAQAFKNELNRITDYVTKLAADTKIECDKYSNDVKFWAEYRTGIKEYSPWLAGAEKAAAEGLSKPSDLNEVKALNEKVSTFDKTCLTYAKVLDAANGAAQKMTTHAEADAEVAGLKERYNKVKAVSDEWVKKVDVLLKEWTLLDNTVTELNSWVAKDKSSEGENQFSLENGIHPWRAQEHLQGEGEACRGPVSVSNSNRGGCCLRPTKRMLHFLESNDLDLNYKNI